MMGPCRLCLVFLTLLGEAICHEHHAHNIAPGEPVSMAPIDNTLWLHIFIQILTWMFILPTGMILGIIRSRWHVPVQTAAIIFAAVGYFLGHAHGGREFRSNAHGQFASFVSGSLTAQTLFGIYLKLHLEHKGWILFRRAILAAHAILGLGMPLIAWCQAVLGGTTAIGICHNRFASQCVLHMLVGSVLVGVGVLLLAIQEGLRYKLISENRRLNQIQEVAVGGSGALIVVTAWAFGGTSASPTTFDMLCIGATWICLFALISCLTWTQNSKVPRKATAGIFLFINGWYLAAKRSPDAPVVYGALGSEMQAAGACQALAAAIANKHSATNDKTIYVLRFLTSYFLSVDGLIFMGANPEQVQLLSRGVMDAAVFILLLHTAAFLLHGSISILMCLLCRQKAGLTDSSVDARGEQLLEKQPELDAANLPSAEHFDLEELLEEP